MKIPRFWNARCEEHVLLQQSIKDLESAVAALTAAVMSARDNAVSVDPSGSSRDPALGPEDGEASFGPKDRKVALATFLVTLVANVVTLAVAGVALLAYHLGPRLTSGTIGGVTLLVMIVVGTAGRRVLDRWFFGGEKIGALGRVVVVLFLCVVTLGTVFYLFFILGKLISVK